MFSEEVYIPHIRTTNKALKIYKHQGAITRTRLFDEWETIRRAHPYTRRTTKAAPRIAATRRGSIYGCANDSFYLHATQTRRNTNTHPKTVRVRIARANNVFLGAIATAIFRVYRNHRVSKLR